MRKTAFRKLKGGILETNLKPPEWRELGLPIATNRKQGFGERQW